jgi:hypothetical protein
MKAVVNLVLWADRFTRFSGGNDVLLFRKMPLALDALEKPTRFVTYSRLASSVKKILKFKYRAGLNSAN